MTSLRDRKKKPEFFTSLPSEIIIDTLSRLPIRTIVICKSVCKSWLNVLRSRQFADFHLPKSAPGLVIGGGEDGWPSKKYKVFGFGDERGIPENYSPLTKFDSTEFTGHSSVMQASAGGLLLHRTTGSRHNDLYVCNPITREYIKLPQGGHVQGSAIVTNGFGVSKISRQHKVVRVIHEYDGPANSDALQRITNSSCIVYVLGTGIWRSVGPPAPFLYQNGSSDLYASYSIGIPLNGNLHWLVKLVDKSHCISCFDLEKETFTTFSLPPLAVSGEFVVSLVVLGGLLSVCQNTDDEIFIWSMMEYGDEKSWSKEFVIEKDDDFEPGFCCGGRDCNILYPLKVFGDGDILIAYNHEYTVYYSNKTKTIEPTDIFELGDIDDDDYEFRLRGIEAMLHTSSLLSLRSFDKESVRLF